MKSKKSYGLNFSSWDEESKFIASPDVSEIECHHLNCASGRRKHLGHNRKLCLDSQSHEVYNLIYISLFLLQYNLDLLSTFPVFSKIKAELLC